MLLLDNGRVSLNGRIFMLPTEVYENVLEAIIAAYEDDLRAELDFYRSRMQPLMRSRTPVRKAGRKAAVVRRVQGKNAAKKPARPRQARTKDMQPVPPPPLQE